MSDFAPYTDEDPMWAWLNAQQQGGGAPAPVMPEAFTAAPAPTEIAGPAPVAPDATAWTPPPLVVDPAAWDVAPPEAPPAPVAAAATSGVLDAIPPAPDAVSGADLAPAPLPDADLAHEGLGWTPPPPIEHTGIGPALGGLGIPLPTPGGAEAAAYGAGNIGTADPTRRQAVLDDMARTNPEQFMRVAAAHKAVGDEMALAEQAKAATKARVDAQANFDAYQKATVAAQADRDKLMAESKQLAATHLDTSRWWSSRSTGEKLAGYISAAIGGLIGVNNGTGRNQALDLITKEIDRDIDAQKFDITNRGAELGRRAGLVGQAFSQAGDLYRAGEMARVAAYDTVIKDIDAQRQAFDPQGTKAIALGNLSMQFQQAKAAAAQAAYDKAFTQHLELAKVEQKDRADAEVARHNRATTALGWGNQSVAAGHLALDQKYRGKEFDLKQQEIDLKRDEVAAKRAEAQAKDDRELGIGGQVVVHEKDGQVADPVTGELRSGRITTVTSEPLRHADGTVYHAPTADAAAKIRVSRNGTQDMYDVLGEVKKLRAKVGGASSKSDKITDSGDQAEYDRLMNKAVIALAASKGITISDQQSVDLAMKSLFGADPSEYRIGDVAGRIDKSLSEATRSYHTILRSNNYDGALPKFESVTPDATLTPTEESAKAVLSDKTASEAAAGTERGVVGKALVEQIPGTSTLAKVLGAQTGAEKARAIEEEYAANPIPGLSNDAGLELKKLIATATTSKKGSSESDAARKMLVDLATDKDRAALRSPILIELLDTGLDDLYDAAVKKLPAAEQGSWVQRKQLGSIPVVK